MGVTSISEAANGALVKVNRVYGLTEDFLNGAVVFDRFAAGGVADNLRGTEGIDAAAVVRWMDVPRSEGKEYGVAVLKGGRTYWVS